MKTVFILKCSIGGNIGYYDGKFNWSEHISDAEEFCTYTDAENKLRKLMEGGYGAYTQIEKYFKPL